jgi:16S rRNA (guanine966-N2)-methyltransferase
MRIIAGKYRSRQLKSLKGLSLRPTSDRLRESLFNILGELVAGSRFIDAFAGTGAVGIEALSRGATEAVFIERHPPAADLIKKNLASLDIRSGTRVLPIDVLQALQLLSRENASASEQCTIFFLDPPYANASDYDRVLSFLGSATVFTRDALVIAEHRGKFELPEVMDKLQRVRVQRQGDTALSFYRSSEKSLGKNRASE